MLQSLMMERFKLVARKEDRVRLGYALIVDKGGPKFKEDDPKTNFMGSHAGQIQLGFAGVLKGVLNMATVAKILSMKGYGPVEDLTGLTGRYDIDLSWTPNLDFEPAPGNLAPSPPPGAADNPAVVERGGSVFAAVREQLGLKLEKRKITTPFLVIDRIERIPTEN